MRVRRVSQLLATGVLLVLILTGIGYAQTTGASVTGFVRDPSNAVIPGAKVTAINLDTGVQYKATTNNAGIYNVVNLPPGRYKLEVEKTGFKTAIRPDVVLRVEQSAAINFGMAIGSMSQSVTVAGGAPLMNTRSGAVSTVVDRNFVKNVPLNGRSFQSLILLTPGIVNTSPQDGGALTGYTGEFNVNGQRSDSNYYSVDGVSANVGTYRFAYGTPGTSGSLPAESSLGTTQNLVPLDDLQEFRIDTSSYSAQFGTTPGAQIIFDTRSGTNQWHGDAYDYLRNTVFDANNWFNDYHGFPNAGERQNDFGGSLGGPVDIPHVYNGKNKTFFFFSYEGVRLSQAVPATISYVPDMALRKNAPAAFQPILNAFPIPNGADTGDGLAEFVTAATNPNTLDSPNIRLDENLSPKLHMFFRFANTTSNAGVYGQFNEGFAEHGPLIQDTRSYTFGADSAFSSNWSNEFRFGRTHNLGGVTSTPAAFGGSVPVNIAQEFGVPDTPTFRGTLYLFFPGANGFAQVVQGSFRSPLTNWNLTDTVGWVHDRHQISFGADYRQTLPDVTGEGSPFMIQFCFSEAAVLANRGCESEFVVNRPQYPVYVNNSLFVQDRWQAAPRLTLDMGLRWEADPAPGNHHHTAAYVLQNAGNPAQATVAPYGTPFYDTAWFNFAPRLGVAYQLRTTPGWETVIRGGGGVFFDTGGQLITGDSYGYGAPGYGAQAVTFSDPWPLTAADLNVLHISNPPTPPYTGGTFYNYPKRLQLPYTLEYNASVQQAFGSSQVLTVSYVGSHAARLTGFKETYVHPLAPNFNYMVYVTSGFTDDYNALQVQYERRMSRGFQALASYTYSHCIDYSSSYLGNTVRPERGNCDYDIRHNVSAAFSYEPPSVQGDAFARGLLNHWGFDDRFTARTGFPMALYGTSFLDPATGAFVASGVNHVSGQPDWLYGSQYPGGKELNPAAFALPPYGTIGNVTRNSLRAFGAWQMDLAIRRTFPIYERAKLEFRAEAFNIFNHPNFGNISEYYCKAGPACQFGQATATLNNSLGGMSPLYQMGGPRSLQLSLALAF